MLDNFIIEGFALEKDPILRWSCMCSICHPSPFAVKDFSFFIELHWWLGQNAWLTYLEADAKWSMCSQMCKKPMGQPCATAITKGKTCEVSSQISIYVILQIKKKIKQKKKKNYTQDIQWGKNKKI